jgi:hypothetical protein
MSAMSRPVVAAVLALLCICSIAAGNVRAAAQVGLLELSGGGTLYHSNDRLGLVWNSRAQALRLEVGAEVTDHIGITAGAMLAEAWIYQVSFLPITARLYWDFSPAELWVRGTTYATATYHHNSFWGDYNYIRPYVALGFGATYTYYAVTTRAELALSASSERPWIGRLLFGVEVGGSYIFGRHHDSDLKD